MATPILSETFLQQYATKDTPFKNHGLGEFVYLRTYSRMKENGQNEQWFETIARVIEGTFSLKKSWFLENDIYWDVHRETKYAERMYDLMFNVKFLPGGRGLWSMGTKITEAKHLYAALNNCAFISTDDIETSLSGAFTFLMDACMLGVGVGFDTKGAGKINIHRPNVSRTITHTITDSREGWVHALKLLLESYFLSNKENIEFNYDAIRKAGEQLGHFGGVSSGSEPLRMSFAKLKVVLDKNAGAPITSKTITDIMNIVGLCVVSGNVRRCLPIGSQVHTDKGLIPIENMKVGDLVLTSDGLHPVTNIYKQGIQKTIKIITEDGEFECTPNHRMAIFDGTDSYVWKTAGSLKEGDRLISSRTQITGQKLSLPEWTYLYSANSTTCKPIQVPDLDEDMSWFIGVFQGDGYTYPNYEKNGFNAYVSLKFQLNELCIAEKAKKQLERFGNELHVTLKKTQNENSYTVHCQSKQLAWYFDKHVKQANKPLNVPDYIKNNMPDIRIAYICGILDADGSAINRPLEVVKSVYPDWVKQLQCLLYSCGIESRLKISKHVPPSREGWQLIHGLVIITQYAREILSNSKNLCKKITKTSRSQNSNGFPSSFIHDSRIIRKCGLYTNNQINIDAYCKCTNANMKWCPVKVLKLEECREVETFDIEVKDKHEFYCNGYLTHNSAEIALGEADDPEFLHLKNYDMYPERAEYGWLSNNSILAKLGMDYTAIADGIKRNGEPGLIWLDNTRKYSRMNHTADMKDAKILGTNPCGEISLESGEMCNLNENFINRHTSLDEFLHTLKYSFMYSKTVSLGMSQWDKTNEVVKRNRRIGSSLTGVTNFLTSRGIGELRKWCSRGYDFLKLYDKKISAAFKIPESIKITSVKPSGTVSLLVPDTCAGMHYPQSSHYIRRVRVSVHSNMWQEMQKRGYEVEPSVTEPFTNIINFPISLGEVRSVKDVPIWEQLELAALLQEVWADNQVSCTVTFNPETEGKQIADALNYFQYKLKGISFLPLCTSGYPQMPYEEITKDKYDQMIADVNKRNTSSKHIQISEEDHETELYCTTDKCLLEPRPKKQRLTK